MDITDVKTKVDKHINENNTLTLRYQNNDLNSSSIDTVINTYFAGILSGTIQRVNGETATIDNQQVTYRLNLNGQHFFLYQNDSSIETQITFFIKNNVIQFIIKATMPPQYNVADSFSEIKNQPTLPINQIILTNSLITLQSGETNSIRFEANLQPSGPLKTVEWMLSGELKLIGTILFQTVSNKQFPIINLEANVLKSFSFGIFELGIIVRLRSVVQSFPNSEPAYLFSSHVELVTEFITSNLTIPVVLPLYGEGQYLLSFYLDITKSPPPINNLNALSGFTAGNNPKDLLNPELAIGQATLALDSLSAVLDPYVKQLVSLEIGISLGLNWTIIANTLELEKIGAVFTINDPARPKAENISAFLFAELKVGSVYLETSVLLPDRILQAQLAPGSEIDVNEVIDTFAKGVSLPGNDKLIIYQLDVFAQVKKGEEAYSLEADAYGTLTIIQGLIIDNIHFFIAYQSQALSEVKLSSTLFLTNIQTELFLIADYQKENGWQFEGGTSPEQAIPIGMLMEDLVTLFGDVTLPPAIEELTIQNLGLSFNTKTKNFTFTCEGELPIDGKQIYITVKINIIQQLDGSYKKHCDGHITIGNLKFALIFDTDRTSTNFLAAYHDDQTIKIKDLIGYIDSQLKDDIPEGLEINLKDALFAYSKQPTLTNFLFGLNIDGGINLSNLPLVGREFPPNQTLKIFLQVLVTKANFTATELQNFNVLYTQGCIQLPTTDINQRLDLIPSIQRGSEIQQLELPITINKQSGHIEGTTPARNNNLPSSVVTPSSSPTQISDSTQYFTLQKSFGPVHFERIGLKYQDSRIWVLLDASLSLAGLTLTLDGLSVNFPLSKFDPQFDLKGIGIDYKGGESLEIGGAFLRTQVTKDGKTYDEYDGAAVIKFNVKGKALTLSAIGSYAYLEGHPSLFIYALLNYPIGGPSFFFVTGLAAGFGYNRSLIVPPIEQIAQFPLVAEAVNPPPSTGVQNDAEKLTNELTKLREYIPPTTGQIFLAVGVKFTSFKLIDGFVLLTVAFGNHFEIKILGLATAIIPTPEANNVATPLAVIQMALKASFIPDEGFLGVNAQLTTASYIFSQDCHLTGGFAFYSWFAPSQQDGDFVLTLGGYHPLFKVPSHYPKVPRLALNWQVNTELNIKADAYFALIPSALMAGGNLQATWNSGPLSAWFNAGADFIIAWKPYHYDASISIDMGVSYTFHFFGTHHITVEVGADLHLWGPEFSGIAHIHLWIISFDVRFGSDASQKPTPIDWQTFKSSFLPADSDICSIVVKDGLVRKINQDDQSDLGIINPKDFCLVTNSAIPAKNAVYQESESSPTLELTTDGANLEFGIASMAITSTDKEFKSTLIITIIKDGIPLTSQEFQEEFACTPILKKVPAALWGESLTPDLSGTQLVENTLSGFEIKPKKQPDPGETHAIDRSNLQFSTELIDNAYRWSTIKFFEAKADKSIADTIVDTSVKQARDNLLKALNLDITEIDIN